MGDFELDKILDNATDEFKISIEQIMKENENLPPILLDLQRIKFEFIELIALIAKFPRTKSYTLSEIMTALDDIKFGMLKSSSVAIHKAFEVLDKFSLITGIFIESLGVLDLVSDLEAKILSSNEVDQMACNGIGAIEKPSLLMNHVYKYNSCPFCKEAIMVKNMIVFVLDENLRAGLTLSVIKQGENGAFHDKT